MNIYQILFWSYLFLAVATLLPTLKDVIAGVKLNPGGASFEQATHFSAENRTRLQDHYTRMMGTLGFWKKRAETYTSFHYYCVIWTILSAWAVPIIASLAPTATSEGEYSKLLIVLGAVDVLSQRR
ncbi:hypothetical protein [Azotobacter chroococcum]|uniref:hypothetical protein n=1 Tax=Azotobacter chroococcum TaxID=353 RepID=UPI0010AE9136|nr:hypothetical protein [Azotobacter chroococcum]TKD44651.1 hypothetical protein FCG41_05805 [Azotobacter chroococcum]